MLLCLAENESDTPKSFWLLLMIIYPIFLKYFRIYIGQAAKQDKLN
jgi:hypothetical protein